MVRHLYAITEAGGVVLATVGGPVVTLVVLGTEKFAGRPDIAVFMGAMVVLLGGLLILFVEWLQRRTSFAATKQAWEEAISKIRLPRYVQGEYLGDFDFPLPNAGGHWRLHVWRNPETKQLFALDNAEVPCDRRWVQDPYQSSVRIRFADTFTGLPK